MKIFLPWVISRGKEASTYAGLMGLATALGLYLSPEMSAAMVQAATAIFGLLAVIIPEAKK